ncbi:MAG: PEP-CTERM sorting domain-containing protein [Phycisphaerae bacterium]
MAGANQAISIDDQTTENTNESVTNTPVTDEDVLRKIDAILDDMMRQHQVVESIETGEAGERAVGAEYKETGFADFQLRQPLSPETSFHHATRPQMPTMSTSDLILDAPSPPRKLRLDENNADSTAPEPITVILVLIGLAAVFVRRTVGVLAGH